MLTSRLEMGVIRAFPSARVVKLADTPDLGSGAVRREGSSPSPSRRSVDKTLFLCPRSFAKYLDGLSGDEVKLLSF